MNAKARLVLKEWWLKYRWKPAVKANPRTLISTRHNYLGWLLVWENGTNHHPVPP